MYMMVDYLKTCEIIGSFYIIMWRPGESKILRKNIVRWMNASL